MQTRHWSIAWIVAVVIALCAPVSARAQGVEVLQHVRLGGYAEDITYVSRGPLARHIVFVDGYEVWGVPGQAHGKPKMRKLFDLRALEISASPRGIAYVESQGVFYVNDPSQTTRLFLVDHQGRPRGTRTIQRLGGYEPWYDEGIGYIPISAGRYSDHLVMVAIDDAGTGARLQFMTLDGHVVSEVVPQCPDEPGAAGLYGVTYLPGDRLLLAFGTSRSLCTVDFDGVPVGPSTKVVGVPIGEGVTRLDDGRIVALAYPQQLLFFDANLTRQPREDRNDIIGLGLMTPIGVGWDHDAERFLVVNYGDGSSGTGTTQVSTVPMTLDRAVRLIDLTNGPYTGARGPAYMADEHLIAVANRYQPFRGVLVYDGNGTLKEMVDLAPRSPSALTYVPGNTVGLGEFVVRYPAEPTTLYFLDRGGIVLRSLDLSLPSTAALANVYAFAYFDIGPPNGGRFIVLGTRSQAPPYEVCAVVTDSIGVPLSQFDPDASLGLRSPNSVAAITTGPLAGGFAMTDSNGGELVIFRLH